MSGSTLSYTSAVSSKPLLGDTIGDLFDKIVARYPDNEALVVRHQQRDQKPLRYTYRQLQQEVNRCARALLALGVNKGQRVGIWSPNCAEWCITQFATAKIGAILVNVNPSYRLHELEYAMTQSGCSWLVSADVFKSSNYTEMLYQLVPGLAESQPGQLQCELLPELRGIITLSQETKAGMLRWQDMFFHTDSVSDEALSRAQAELNFDDPINIQYTSGTTGFPKGATLSHHNILNNGFFVAESMGFTAEDRLVIPVPLYHCFGMVMGNLGCVTHGATMIYSGDGFDPLAVLQTVAEEKATALYGVPTMFIAELNHPEFEQFDLSTLRTGIMAGSPCPIEVMKKVIERMHMAGVQIAYGMTETSPVSLQTGSHDPLEKRVGSVGRTQPHLENKIIGPDGSLMPRGEIGELCTRGYSVMLKYWNNPKATEDSIDQAGWMHTGDLAVMDEEGYVRIVGRSKDMIIRGGENVYPREIEEFLYTHPDIADVQVTGVPDEKYGEEIIAWIKPAPGHSPSEDDIKDFCKGKIAHFKIPRYIKFVDTFPMTVTGKIQKFRMREISTEELGLKSLS